MAKFDTQNTSRYWHVPSFHGVELLSADFTTHEYMPHAHPCFVIAVTELGGSEFKSRGKTDMANKEKLLVFNPSEPHSGRMGGSKRWRYRSFYLGEQSTKHLMSMLGLEQTGHFITNTIHDPKLIDIFLKLHHSLEEKDEPSDPMGQQEMFIHSFGNLFQSHAQKKS